jgi:hypothetical protein
MISATVRSFSCECAAWVTVTDSVTGRDGGATPHTWGAGSRCGKQELGAHGTADPAVQRGGDRLIRRHRPGAPRGPPRTPARPDRVNTRCGLRPPRPVPGSRLRPGPARVRLRRRYPFHLFSSMRWCPERRVEVSFYLVGRLLRNRCTETWSLLRSVVVHRRRESRRLFWPVGVTCQGVASATPGPVVVCVAYQHTEHVSVATTGEVSA